MCSEWRQFQRKKLIHKWMGRDKAKTHKAEKIFLSSSFSWHTANYQPQPRVKVRISSGTYGHFRKSDLLVKSSSSSWINRKWTLTTLTVSSKNSRSSVCMFDYSNFVTFVELVVQVTKGDKRCVFEHGFFFLCYPLIGLKPTRVSSSLSLSDHAWRPWSLLFYCCRENERRGVIIFKWKFL